MFRLVCAERTALYCLRLFLIVPQPAFLQHAVSVGAPAWPAGTPPSPLSKEFVQRSLRADVLASAVVATGRQEVWLCSWHIPKPTVEGEKTRRPC